MTDDLDAVRAIDHAMAMVKMKSFRCPRINQINHVGELVIMIACNQQNVAIPAKPLDQVCGFARRCTIMDKIAKNNQTQRIICAEQFFEALFNCLHSPKRKKVPGCALA